MRIAGIFSEAAMRDLAPEWAALWRRAAAAAPWGAVRWGTTPFQSPAWLLAWWRHFGSGAPRLLTARTGGRLAGVLPLYLLAEPGIRKLLPIGIGVSDYIDALVDPARPEAGAAMLAAIADIADWDECHLPDLPEGGVLHDARGPAGLEEERRDGAPCPVLALPARLEALAAVVPCRRLRDVRQAAARAVAAGGMRIERIAGEAVGAALDDLFRLHAARWRSRGEAGVLGDPAVRAFHREAAPALAEAGMLRLYRMRIGGAVAAVYYAFAWRGRVYAYIGGFDPEMRRFSPGTLILRHAIGEAIAEGCAAFDFLRGAERYKYAWGAADCRTIARTWRR
jgi:CelD/BcsL family acetyltransferase involved in cellulose biosynthesis